MDYALEEQLQAQALKEALANQAAAEADVPGSMVSGRWISPGKYTFLKRGLQEGVGMLGQQQAEAQMRALRGQQVAEIEDLFKQYSTPTPDIVNQLPPDQAGPPQITPPSPLDESRRRMLIGQKLSMLPLSAKIGQDIVKSEVDFPEKQALAIQNQANAQSLAASRQEFLTSMAQHKADLQREIEGIRQSGAASRAQLKSETQPKPPSGYEWDPVEPNKLRPIINGPADQPSVGQKEQTVAYTRLDSSLSNLEEKLKAFSEDPTNMAKYGEYASAHADAKIQWKEAAKLGALTGPDVTLIDSVIGNPLSWEGAASALASGVTGQGYMTPFLSKIGEARRAAQRQLQIPTRPSAQPEQRFNLPPTEEKPWSVKGTKDDPVPVKDPREASVLPSGVWFRTPDGRILPRK